ADEEIAGIAFEPARLTVLGLRERVADLGLGRLADIDTPIAVLRNQRGCCPRARRALRRLRVVFRLYRLFCVLLRVFFLRLRLRGLRRRLRERRKWRAEGEDACSKASKKRARGHVDFLNLGRVSYPRRRTSYSRTNEKKR